MKIGQLIQTLEGLQDREGDVEFVFDWGADCVPLLKTEISLNYDEHCEIHILAFDSYMPPGD